MTATTHQLDPLYVAARRVLLDALDALVDHKDAIVLAGAQAIYVRTGSADLDASVSPYTSDADLAIDPRQLGPDSRLEEAMSAAGFHQRLQRDGRTEPGIWTATTIVNDEEVQIPVDLLVPDALAVGSGRRSARLPHHDANAARRTPGLEAAIVDCGPVTIASLQPEADTRRTTIRVAGTGGLLVAKVYKINDRLRDAAQRKTRLQPKDASDIIRLMGAEPAEEIGVHLASIADDQVAGATVREGVRLLHQLFGRRRSPRRRPRRPRARHRHGQGNGPSRGDRIHPGTGIGLRRGPQLTPSRRQRQARRRERRPSSLTLLDLQRHALPLRHRAHHLWALARLGSSSLASPIGPPPLRSSLRRTR